MPRGLTFRTIKGIKYKCRDIGCPDFARAARNRLIVADGLFTTGYLLAEMAIKSTPLRRPLPSWVPIDELAQVSKKDWRQSSGEEKRLHEVE